MCNEVLCYGVFIMRAWQWQWERAPEASKRHGEVVQQAKKDNSDDEPPAKSSRREDNDTEEITDEINAIGFALVQSASLLPELAVYDIERATIDTM